MPAAPTNVTLVEEGDSAETTLTWNHNQTDLDRFEVLWRESGDEPWESIALAPAADFGSGGSYSFEFGMDYNEDVTVRALSSTGAVSMNNPFRRKTFATSGIWLVPWFGGKIDRDMAVRIQAQTADYDVPVTSSVFEVVNRRSKVVQLGKQHGYEGTIGGFLLPHTFTNGPRTGETITAQGWAWRIERLIRRQYKYRIAIHSRHIRIPHVVFPEGHRISAELNPERIYTVEMNFVEIFQGRRRHKG